MHHLLARQAARSLRSHAAAVAAVPAPARAQPVRYLRSTGNATPPPPPPASSAAENSSPDAAAAADSSARQTQTGQTPSAEAVPPLESAEHVAQRETVAQAAAQGTPPPNPADPAAPAGQVSPQRPEKPADALATRESSIAEAFLDLHPDVAPRTEFPGDKTGAKARGAGKSSIEKRRANLARAAGAATLAGLLWMTYDLGKDWADEEEAKKMYARSDDQQAVEEAEQGGWLGWWGRLKIRAADQLDYLNKPAWDPLLPAPLPEPHYRPYTLVIDLEDMLTHDTWDLEHGWRTAKRPGADYFLAYMSQFYEIVLFTTLPSYLAIPVIEKLDPYGAYIPWKLFKEATRYKNGMHIKDLSYLNRPLERTVILDIDPSRYQLQPDNGITLQPWHGSKGDASANELVAMIPFLEALAIKRVKDVRPVIKHYEGKHIPTAYMEAEKRTKQEMIEKWEQQKKDSSVKGWISSLFSGLTQGTIRDAPPETEVEQMRKAAQRLYLEEQKYWKDNAAIIEQQIEEDKQRQLKEMSNSVAGMIGLAPPRPAGAQ